MKTLVLCCIMCGMYITTFSANHYIKNYRLRWNYVHNHYDKVIKLGKKLLKYQPKKPLVNYCYAISLFQQNKKKMKISMVDKVLNHLKIGLDTTKEKIEFIQSDTTVLRTIKENAIQITLSEYAKSPTKSLTRIQTIVAIYGDSVEVYRVFKEESDRINNLKSTFTFVKPNKKEPIVKEEQKLVYTVEKTSKKELLDTIEKYCGEPLNDKQKQLLKTVFAFNNVSNYAHGTNPVILKFFHETGFRSIKNDEVSWCAAFVNFCMQKQGYSHPKTLLAKSWLNMGQPVNDPKPGDIVIFWRGKQSGWQGHVGFFIKEDKENNLIYVYGGNQGGAVCLKPFSKTQILGYRRVLPN